MRLLRLAVWVLSSCSTAKRQLRVNGSARVLLRRPPVAGSRYTKLVERVLWYRRTTCLVRSCVLQQWLEANGEYLDVVIGVTSPETGFRAHAWLDRGACEFTEFTEISRIATCGPARG